mmetsp:Transcript_9977/g.26582  ORF Transcript_9977/g.26582 Transcript_9977/m.26582 type:complete len:128 (+) Transcript_9977:226-609(+)
MLATASFFIRPTWILLYTDASRGGLQGFHLVSTPNMFALRSEDLLQLRVLTSRSRAWMENVAIASSTAARASSKAGMLGTVDMMEAIRTNAPAVEMTVFEVMAGGRLVQPRWLTAGLLRSVACEDCL